MSDQEIVDFVSAKNGDDDIAYEEDDEDAPPAISPHQAANAGHTFLLYLEQQSNVSADAIRAVRTLLRDVKRIEHASKIQTTE
jgi:hypothetical protein